MGKLKSFFQKNRIEAGCDEAGRGCLAGPVVAAAVILNPQKPIRQLNDSKKLSKKQRNVLRLEVEKKAFSYAVAFVSPEKIDEINILNASFLAMHKAVDELTTTPEILLIDGNRFNPHPNIPHECFIKGDGKYQSIAAASILAKTYRDAYMEKIHNEFPMFDWINNKGYPTIKHRQALDHHPKTKYHRKSFQLKSQQLKMKF